MSDLVWKKCGHPRTPENTSGGKLGKSRSQCRLCKLDSSAKWKAENSDKIKACEGKWRSKNKEKIRARNAKYRAENADKIRIARSKAYFENPEKYKSLCARWRSLNPNYQSNWHVLNEGGE